MSAEQGAKEPGIFDSRARLRSTLVIFLAAIEQTACLKCLSCSGRRPLSKNPPSMKPLAIATTFLLGIALVAAEPRFLFDFNGMSTGANLIAQIDDSPNASGGWVGKSGVPQVIADDLIAPAGTNYALAPSLTAGRMRATRTDNAFRGQFHRVTSSAGVMWVSALIRAVDQSAAAVVIEGADTANDQGYTLQNKAGFGIRPDATAGNTELFWSENLISMAANQRVMLPVDYSGQTVLVVARIAFGAAGKNVDLWVNPVLTRAVDLGTTGILEATTTRTSMSWVGAGAVNTGLVGYTVEFDNLAFSNAASEEIAFAEIAGLPLPPEPPVLPGRIALDLDFNDLAPGVLRDRPDDSPQVLGAWTGISQIPLVEAGDLIAPTATRYAASSHGIAGRVMLARSDNLYRGQFHRVAAGDGPTWFSALIRAADGSAAAVVIDGNADDATLGGKAGFGIRPDAATGSTALFWSDDLGSMAGAAVATIPSDFSGQTVLVVGRIDLKASGSEVDLWLNPTLATRTALFAAVDLRATSSRSRLDWIGFGVVDDGDSAYEAAFDNLRFCNDSDEDRSFAHVTGVVPPPFLGQADVNGNGLTDLSELAHPGLSDLAPAGDEDRDGLSNAEEGVARTDPFSADSVLRATRIRPNAEGGSYEFAFTSVPGVRYRISASADLATWSQLGNPVIATSANTTVMLPLAALPAAESSFVRAEVAAAVDADGDGLEDALELFLGFDPNHAASVRDAASGGDLQQYVQLMSGGSVAGGLFGASSAGVPSDEQASRFLAQASFGPTMSKIAGLKALGPDAYEKWIDAQLAVPPSFLRSYIDLLTSRMASDAAATNYTVFPHFVTPQTSFAMYRENVNTVWMRQALFAPDELRQRTAWALSQIVVVGPQCNSYGIAAADWYDTVIRNSLGSYRTLLYEIAVHPWMGWYLSHIGNRKANPDLNQMPDENFAREIMQLFSIGLWELNMDGTRKLDAEGRPIPTYDSDDIEQLARVFTGLDLQAGATGQGAYAVAPMRMIDSRHDIGDAVSVSVYGAAEKNFLGASLPSFANDPGRTGLDDVNDAVDILINHPSCPPFVCTNLIQHLVTSNPTPAYVGRVSAVFADDGNGTRGNLAAVIKAILLDPEARDFAASLDPVAGRLKEPMLRTVAVARAFGAGSATPALHDLTGIQFWSPAKESVFSDFLEYPFEYPSVFNFYEPGYSRPGEIRDLGLFSPEFEIMNALTATTVPNRLWSFVRNGFHNGNPAVTPSFKLELDPLRGLTPDTGRLLDRVNLLLCHGSLSPEGRVRMRETIDHWIASDANWKDRADLAIYLALVSPDGAVLK
ncbi:MAG: DUF1800 family protein [Verrucomicrobia bacterium]|nr:MAG: DUF1800 family protein [Verrucomicrobiota bacterium]TAE87801.1 MAG: DUF1800 family protein [Verrucomicrobiota bacterium]TAF25544.1 MAG: DUF1800 family protein [Verrucomicrobiota bacterium]